MALGIYCISGWSGGLLLVRETSSVMLYVVVWAGDRRTPASAQGVDRKPRMDKAFPLQDALVRYISPPWI